MGLGLNAMSALSVVVFQMLVGSVAADTKATTEMLTHSTTTHPSTLGPLRLPRRRFYPWYFFPP